MADSSASAASPGRRAARRTPAAARATGRAVRPPRRRGSSPTPAAGCTACRRDARRGAASASITAFCTAGVEPMVAASPMPLAPSGLSGVGVSVDMHLERRQLGGGGDPVVGEVAVTRVAVGVVADLLEQRLPDAGGDAAVLLALDEQRVDHRAAVVDGDVAQEAHGARVEVDLDDGDVGAERERGPVLVGTPSSAASVSGSGERRRPAVGQLGPRQRRGRHAGDADRPAASCRRRRRPDRPRASTRPGARARSTSDTAAPMDRRPAELQRPRAPGAAAAWHEVGVAVDEGDPLDRDAGRSWTSIAYAVWWPCPCDEGAGAHRRRAVVVHLERAELAVVAAGGDLHVGRRRRCRAARDRPRRDGRACSSRKAT